MGEKMKKLFANKYFQAIIILVITCTVTAGLAILKTSEYKSWAPADGIVTGWKPTAHRGRFSGPHHILFFDYTVEENTYSARETFGGNYPSLNIGDPVTVWYASDDVSKAVISNRRPDARLWSIAPFFLAAPIELCVLTGGFKRKSRELKQTS